MAVSVIKGRTYEELGASDFITFESGFSSQNNKVYIARDGNVVYGRFVLSTSIAINANQQNIIGTIKSGYRPKVMTSIGGIAYYGLIDDNGSIYVRPYQAKNPGAYDNITFSYIV